MFARRRAARRKMASTWQHSSSGWELLPCTLPRGDIVMTCAYVPSKTKIAAIGRHTHHYFDTETQTWLDLPRKPFSAGYSCSVMSHRDNIYVVENDSIAATTLIRHDDEEVGWRKLPPMTVERNSCAATVFQGSIVVSSGCCNDNFDFPADLPTTELFGIENPTPSEPLYSMFDRRRSTSVSASIGKRMYAFGGYGGTYQTALRSAEFFDGTWKSLPRMRRGRYRPSAVSVGRFILLIGGKDENRNCIAEVDCFDTITHQWMNGIPPLNMARTFCGAAYIRGEVYVFGGLDDRVCTLCSMERLKFDPYYILVPRLLRLFKKENLPVSLWPFIIAGYPASVVYFILVSERLHLDSVLLSSCQETSDKMETALDQQKE